jgi:hypothetical protein
MFSVFCIFQFFFSNLVVQILIGMAIISIATGHCISITHRALIMTMHMNKFYQVAAEQTLLHSGKINPILNKALAFGEPMY